MSEQNGVSPAPTADDSPGQPADAASTASASIPRTAKKRDSETNIKETIESILIAFILAFMFRAFVVEAFVIPTGSMATTLLGAHMRFTCEDCGYVFDVNFPSDSDNDDIDVPDNSRRVFSMRCPNCGFKVPRENPKNPLNSATGTPSRYGDRILVLKYLYLLHPPQRWDVVVFKSPDDPEHHDYALNYIKRLVGLPGEALMILDGDIYTAPTSATAPLKLGDFKIQRKPRSVQNSLWRVVYDNDYLPLGQKRRWIDREGVVFNDKPWQQPWEVAPGEQGWQLTSDPSQPSSPSRSFKFDNLSGSADLRFSNDANSITDPLTDVMWYDTTFWQRNGDSYNDDSYRGDQNVSDIKLEFFYQRTKGDGELKIAIDKLQHRFNIVIHAGKATIFQNDKAVASAELSDDFANPSHIEVENADYRLSLRVNDHVIASVEYEPDTNRLLEAFESRTKLPKPHIQITAANQTSELTHVKLWRDIYYGNRTARSHSGGDFQWASPLQFPKRVIQLGGDDFFVCGDNSPLSGDARTWGSSIELPEEDLFTKPGRVPRRFMLGKAFFVYWPSGYKPFKTAPAIAPNFGDMRFIH